MANVKARCGVGKCEQVFSSILALREHKLKDHAV